jgi:hypothetical protein
MWSSHHWLFLVYANDLQCVTVLLCQAVSRPLVRLVRGTLLLRWTARPDAVYCEADAAYCRSDSVMSLLDLPRAEWAWHGITGVTMLCRTVIIFLLGMARDYGCNHVVLYGNYFQFVSHTV